MIVEAPALADLDGIRHGFGTRRGGVSTGAFATLNCGLRGGDELHLVLENRRRLAARLGHAEHELVAMRQVHGIQVVTVEEPWPADQAPEADALVTCRPGLLLGVLTADCVPILLADPESGVVGAAHAGWRGTRDGIVRATVEAMARLGASPQRIVAVVGPAIGELSYEVGPDLVQAFVDADARHAMFFRPGEGDRSMFDLKGLVLEQLLDAGVGRLEMLPYDTCAEEDLFFSNRRRTKRGEERFGLQLSVIGRAHSPT